MPDIWQDLKEKAFKARALGASEALNIVRRAAMLSGKDSLSLSDLERLLAETDVMYAELMKEMARES